jgi:predicted acylesterase/phospholipase RssA/CRP-like cAMP-binding protein
MFKQPDDHPSAAAALALVRRCALFADADDEVCAEVARGLAWRWGAGGEVLVGPGAPPEGAYLVLQGKVGVARPITAGRATREVGVGELVGAVGLSGEAEPYTARALQDTEVGVLTRAAFERAAGRAPALWRRLAELIGREARALAEGARQPPSIRHIAVLPAQVDDALFGEFVGRFTEALRSCRVDGGASRAVGVIGADDLDAALGAGAADDEVADWNHDDRRIQAWIDEASRDADVVLLRGHRERGEWTRRCIRQSELVVFVSRAPAEPGAAPGPDEVAEVLPVDAVARDRDCRLVLLHDAGRAEPKGTGEWLDRWPGVAQVHHVRRGDGEHYGRLARHLTGAAVGLVLGGGGARGQAHLGVLRALRECGVHVDAVGGTSAGGGIAALSTYEGASFEDTRRTVWKAFVEMAPFSAYSLPFHSVMSKPAVEAPAQEIAGDRLIEDLWLPYFCVSCDISRRQKVVHRRGKLWKALCATTALPGVLPPVVMRGMILVDGGVVDNIPVEPMRDLTRGPLIVVDVGAPNDDLVDRNVLDLPLNATVILSHVHPLLDPITVPNLLTVVMSTMDLADKVRHRERPDLLIRPDVGRFGMTEFESQRELIEEGYAATVAALRRLRDDAPAAFASLGADAAKLDAIAPTDPALMAELREQREGRAADARAKRAALRAAGMFVAGLALAGVLQTPGIVPLALVLSLLLLLVAIVGPKVRARLPAPPRRPSVPVPASPGWDAARREIARVYFVACAALALAGPVVAWPRFVEFVASPRRAQLVTSLAARGVPGAGPFVVGALVVGLAMKFAVFAAAAAMLVWRGHRRPFPLVLAAGVLAYGIGIGLPIDAPPAAAAWVIQLNLLVAMGTIARATLTLPQEQFVKPWRRALFAAWLGLEWLVLTPVFLPWNGLRGHPLAANLTQVALLLAGLAAMGSRFVDQHAEGRQQLKWFMWGIGTSAGAFVIKLFLGHELTGEIFSRVIYPVLQCSTVLALAVAVVKDQRLWRLQEILPKFFAWAFAAATAGGLSVLLARAVVPAWVERGRSPVAAALCCLAASLALTALGRERLARAVGYLLFPGGNREEAGALGRDALEDATTPAEVMWAVEGAFAHGWPGSVVAVYVRAAPAGSADRPIAAEEELTALRSERPSEPADRPAPAERRAAAALLGAEGFAALAGGLTFATPDAPPALWMNLSARGRVVGVMRATPPPDAGFSPTDRRAVEAIAADAALAVARVLRRA